MGLNEKSFKLKQTYNKGDYVFSRSSSDSKKHTMYTAQSTFTAEKEPYKDTNTSHWVEFTAPQGERGEKGDKGDEGKKGEKGDQGEKGQKKVVKAKKVIKAKKVRKEIKAKKVITGPKR